MEQKITLPQDIIDRFDKIGFCVEDCSDWTSGGMKSSWNFIIRKKNDPTYLWQFANTLEELEELYQYFTKKDDDIEEIKQIKKNVLPTDELGTILCKQLGLLNAHSMNVVELVQCIKYITKEKFVYATHEDKAHRRMLFYSEKLAEMGLTTFKVNSGNHIIYVAPTDNKGWYSAKRLDARQEKSYFSMLKAKRERLKR